MTDEDDIGFIPLVEERLKVTTREVVTGRVRVSSITETFEEVVRQELRGMRIEVVRVPIDRILEPGETPPGPRTEGDTTILPIFEEILVVEKRLVLKEEVHIVRSATFEQVETPVELRRQRASIERLPAAGETSDPDA